MLIAVRSRRFKRDVKKLNKRGKDMEKLKAVLLLLLTERALPERLRDHPLGGDLNGFRDLHIEPDWLLVYRVANGELQLARTGSHSDLFRD